MGFNLLTISSMYPGYLEMFYNKYPHIMDSAFTEHYDALLADSTEFAASYTKTFCKLGINATAIISNDDLLQNKWRLQYGVRNTDHKSLIYQQILIYNPDILWIEDLRYIDLKLLHDIKQKIKSIKLIIAYHCSPWNTKNLKKLRAFDLVITCTPGLRQQFENAGLVSYLVYHGFDKDLLPGINDKSSHILHKVIFSGSLFPGEGYHNQRIDLIDHILRNGVALSLFVNVEKKYKILAKKIIYFINKFLKSFNIENPGLIFQILEYGKFPVRSYPESILKVRQKPEYGKEMYRLLQNSEIVLNNHGDVAGNYAGNMRLFEATGLGSCLLTDNKSNLNDLFDVNTEIVVYNDADECIEKIQWLLENEDERKKIAVAGQQKTLKSHTVEERCKLIIEIIQKELQNRGN
jgi:spore maturation protein CgeB